MLPKTTNEVMTYWYGALRGAGLLQLPELEHIQWNGMFAEREIGQAEELLLAMIIKDLTGGVASIADYNRLFFKGVELGAGALEVASLVSDASQALIAISSFSDKGKVYRNEIATAQLASVELEVTGLQSSGYELDELDQAHFALLQADHEIRYHSHEMDAATNLDKDLLLAEYLGVHRICVTIARLCPSMQADGKVIAFFWPELCDLVDKLADTASKIAKYRL